MIKEDDILKAYFQYVNYKKVIDPKYGYIIHVPNEAKRTMLGYVNMKRKGLAKGFPDVICLYPTKYARGLAIEVKKPGGKVSEDQELWLEKLKAISWVTKVLYDIDEMCLVTDGYFDGSVKAEW